MASWWKAYSRGARRELPFLSDALKYKRGLTRLDQDTKKHSVLKPERCYIVLPVTFRTGKDLL